jgi:pimeloyl-ACP methyl ester carboxylesterase
MLTHALHEIERRVPDYLARFPLSFASPDHYYQKHVSSYPQTNESLSSFATKFDDGLEYLRRCGARIETSRRPCDPVADMLAETLADAVGPGRLAMPETPATSDFRSRFKSLYREDRTDGGRRYFIRQGGRIPLLLISALGIPLHVWSRLLLDEAHDFRIIVVETRACDLLEGGMNEKSSVEEDCADLVDVIGREGLRSINILAWCNGAKIALELAGAAAGALRSLTFVSPSLSAVRAAPEGETKYESGLRQIITAAARNPGMAQLIARGFAQLSQPVDWDSLAGRIEDRARILFGLSAQEHASALSRPFAGLESLRRYSQRGCRDYAYPSQDRLEDLRVPCLVIGGDSDHVVSSAPVKALLGSCRSPVIYALIGGAGHYTFDLQYPYFRSILAQFTNGLIPAPRVRVRVEASHHERSLEHADAECTG